MDRLTAHYHFAQLGDDELFALLGDIRFMGGTALEMKTLLPLFATAAAELSGGMDDATTIDDLRECCSHFRSLWDAEVIDAAAVNNAAAETFQELCAVHERDYQGEQQQRSGFSPAELN